MKDYHKVVEDRYNKESDSLNSIYAPDQPIGKYSRSQIFPCLKSLLKNNISASEDYSQKTLLDVGCGNGGMITFFLENGFKATNTVGIDLSERRINEAKKTIAGVTFMTENGLSFNLQSKFDLITTFDMYSHITSEQEIIEGLKNIHLHLNENGTFIWYDIFCTDHYSPPPGCDSWGFSDKQMQEPASKSGFVLIEKKTIFKNIFGKYNSLYQARRFPFWMIRLMEKLLPGTPGNIVMVFRKA